MTTPLARALLDWYRINACDSTPQGAWHTLHRNGLLALTACRTIEDHAAVAAAMAVAEILVQQLPTWAINPPAGCEVEFNRNRVTLWCAGTVVDAKEIAQ